MSTQRNTHQSGQKKDSTTGKEAIQKPKLLMRSVPLYLLLLLTIIPLCSLIIYFRYFPPQASINALAQVYGQSDPVVTVVRGNELGLVRPLLFIDIEDAKTLSPVKIKISDYLDQKNREGALTSASVYLKDLNSGFCFNINADSLYDPASLMKVPLLMICLKEAETNPALLKKTYLFTRNAANKTVKLIKDKSLVEGKNYTVEELLYYMIVYSDNEAFWILKEYLDDKKLNELDAKLGIPSNFDNVHYPATEKHIVASAKSVSHYFNVLYNASYLNKTMSVYALNLLTKSTYKNGLAKDINPDLTIAHKFGERTLSYMAGDHLENLQSEFHEFGIVYLGDHHYLLGVMTRGNQSDQLQAIVGYISKIVYDELAVGK